jgi:hypothetical protein
MPATWRARVVDYLGLERNVAIASAAVGGLLRKLAPEVPFVAAGVIGLAGTIVFAATVEERYAS